MQHSARHARDPALGTRPGPRSHDRRRAAVHHAPAPAPRRPLHQDRRAGIPAWTIDRALTTLERYDERLRCHPHALRLTCARELLRTGATIADVQHLLDHASIKTTSIYLTSDEQRQEDAVIRRERGGLTLDEDLDGPTADDT
jgi:integrase